jgi:quinol monooxygenase YgiN
MTLEPSQPLGSDPDADYLGSNVVLNDDDRLTLYTDGVLEATNSEGDLYGFERVTALTAERPDAESIAKTAPSIRPRRAVEAIKALRSITIAAQVKRGFISSRIYQEVDNPEALCLEHEWSSEPELKSHIRSSCFTDLLMLMETALEAPMPEVNLVSEIRGLAAAQQVTGTLGQADATTTINGKQIPEPPPKFGGVIKESAKDSTPWWPPRVVPPKGAQWASYPFYVSRPALSKTTC